MLSTTDSSSPAASPRARNPLPEGTLPVGIGLLVSGIALYGVISIASRGLGKTLDAPFAVFWPALFVCGPGFFLPLEQEVGRALAARRVRGQGGAPLIRRAAVAGGLTATLLVIVIAAVSGPITSKLFSGYSIMTLSLGAGLVAYYAEYLVRGTLSGNGRFRAYGLLMGSEGVFRVAGCLVLWLVFHSKNPSYYAATMVIGSLLATVVALRGQHQLVRPGPPAPWSELSSALGFLLATSVLNSLLINIGPIALELLATTDTERQQTGPFLNGLILSRVPLFLFQAVQAALLPKLAGLASAGQHHRLRRALLRLSLFVVALGVLATVGSFVLGPLAMRIMFGPEFQLGNLDLALLAAASSTLMLAIVFTQALIALHGYARTIIGWAAGMVGFVVITSLGNDLFGRIERGLLGGALATTLVQLALMLPLISGGDRDTDALEDAATEEMIEASRHVVAEP